jgi:ANTAR domain
VGSVSRERVQPQRPRIRRHAYERERHRLLAEALAEITERRCVIEQIKGMLMLVYHLDDVQAFELLRQRSQATNIKLRTLAQQFYAISPRSALVTLCIVVTSLATCFPLMAIFRRQAHTSSRSICPSGVLRHLVTDTHVRDASERKRLAGRHYPIHRRCCVTLQHRWFHTGSVGVRGSSPLSSTSKTRSELRRSGFFLVRIVGNPPIAAWLMRSGWQCQAATASAAMPAAGIR